MTSEVAKSSDIGKKIIASVRLPCLALLSRSCKLSATLSIGSGRGVALDALVPRRLSAAGEAQRRQIVLAPVRLLLSLDC